MRYLNNLSRAPEIRTISNIQIPSFEEYTSENDISVINVKKKDCGVIKIDITFRAGRPQESTKMAAAACGAILTEGAGKFSSKDLSEQFDFLGASVNAGANLDFISIRAVCLKKHFKKILNLLTIILHNPHFHTYEWNHYKEKSKHRLKVQLAKNDIKSYRLLTEEMYGINHPYGYNSSEELYDSLSIDEIRLHYESYLTAQNCQIFIAGDIEERDLKSIDQLCKNIPAGGENGRNVLMPEISTSPITVKAPGNISQSSIRIGRLACNRNHEDFYGLNYLCTVLGGYFGSRLVQNIREEKGLTYNIYCALDNQVFGGDIMISTEVANENVKYCLEQIYLEMERLRGDLLGDEELQTINNYMMGNYLNLFDGPFNSMRAIKSLALANIPLDNIHTLIKSSLSFDANQIRKMARKYFDRNDFWEVIVGIPQSE